MSLLDEKQRNAVMRTLNELRRAAPAKPGEQYGYDTYKFDGDVYDWKTHMECDAVSTFLWDYVDPWEGMTSDDFLDACADVCRTFVCPDCEHFDSEHADDGDYCQKNEPYCIHKLYELSKKYYIALWKTSS